MKILLLQLDGRLPNIALMRLSAHWKERGADVELRKVGNPLGVEPELFDSFDQVYASLIFKDTRPLAERLKSIRPDAVIGGTGWDYSTTIEALGVTTLQQDYTIYPRYRHSIGFTQRGCRLRCDFCVVPQKEGPLRAEQTIAQLWRGDPYPRRLVLLDNDFFGQSDWRALIAAIRDGGFAVSLCQGINARFLDEETAAAIASVNYRSLDMKSKCIHTAWDYARDEKRLMRGLELLKDHGVDPRHIMVYMLIGAGESAEDREHRRKRLREFGALPYPMLFTSDSELSGFRRWVLTGEDKRTTWEDFKRAKYQDRNVRKERNAPLRLPGLEVLE